MTLEQITEYLLLYPIGKAVSFEELPRTTSGNTSYVIHTAENMYVLRTLVRQSSSSIDDEHTIQILLNNAGIVTPLYIKSVKGNLVETIDDRSVVISECIPGSRQSIDTISLAQNMGSTLAIMHNVLATTQIAFNEQQWFNPRNTQSQLEQYTGPDKQYVTDMTKKYLVILQKNLPLTTTHGDFHTNNIFSANDKVTAVFDFESAEYTVRILDIARLYLTYIKVTDLDPTKILSAIVNGYNSKAEKPLTDEEHAELSTAFIYVALVSSVSIYNHGNSFSSSKYLEIAKGLIQSQRNTTR